MAAIILNVNSKLDRARMKRGETRRIEWPHPFTYAKLRYWFFLASFAFLLATWVSFIVPAIRAAAVWTPVNHSYQVFIVSNDNHLAGIRVFGRTHDLDVIRTTNPIVKDQVQRYDTIVLQGYGAWTGVFYTQATILRGDEVVLVLDR
ncbi:MAG: hypothetical protein AAF914_08060 [Pseudomonadota bacterium]